MENIKKLTAEDVIRECNGELVCGTEDIVFEDFCRDTREIKPGDIYVGIKGENHNGNTIYEEALKGGARGCILQGVTISKEIKEKYSDRAIILVENTIKALQQLATYKRKLYDIPVVAITGSVGKTSTKDIVASVMAKKYKVLKTEGNYNNQLGLPLTVLRLKDHEALVVEMGMNQLGEISNLTKIAKPTVAIITNVGTAHIGNLGSRENILKAKLEILDGLKENGILIINNDNDMLHNWYIENKRTSNENNKYNIITYGMDNDSNMMAYNTILAENSSTYSVKINEKEAAVKIGTPGKYFVSNSLCALSVGNIFNIPVEDILEGIEHFELTKRRMQVEKMNNNVIIINDCYNANYDSMKAAIEYLAKLENYKKIAVLGDMLELGDYSEILHRQVGKEIADNNIDILITVGKEAKNIADEAKKLGMISDNIYIFDNNDQATIKLKELLEKGNVSILIKASNGMKFQEIFDAICNKEE